MSNNPQWKSFQPPAMNSDSSILDFAKSLTIQNNAPPPSNYRNPANGSGYNSSNNFHPGSNIKNLSNNVFSNTSSNFTNYNAYQTNNSRFPQIGTFSSDSTDMYGGENPPVNNTYNSSSNNSNSTYNDSSQNNQGTRETGIIEKLLVDSSDSPAPDPSSILSLSDYEALHSISILSSSVNHVADPTQILSPSSDDHAPDPTLVLSTSCDDQAPDRTLTLSPSSDNQSPDPTLILSPSYDDQAPDHTLVLSSSVNQAPDPTLIHSPSYDDQAPDPTLVLSSSVNQAPDPTLIHSPSYDDQAPDPTLFLSLSSDNHSTDPTLILSLSYDDQAPDPTLVLSSSVNQAPDPSLIHSPSSNDQAPYPILILSSSSDDHSPDPTLILSPSVNQAADPTQILSPSSDDHAPDPILILSSSSDDQSPYPTLILSTSSDDQVPDPTLILSTSSDNQSPDPTLILSSSVNQAPDPTLVLSPSSDDQAPDPILILSSSSVNQAADPTLILSSSVNQAPDPTQILSPSSDDHAPDPTLVLSTSSDDQAPDPTLILSPSSDDQAPDPTLILSPSYDDQTPDPTLVLSPSVNQAPDPTLILSPSSDDQAPDPTLVLSQAPDPTYLSQDHPHSYGFIQCCERQARLFFHFSQFSGNIEHLKIGDPVEFEMTYDRRTGKPIASTVTKIAPEVVLSEERVTGTVTTELRSDGSGSDTQGRISYENRGECFFLPYNKDDVEGNVTLRAGDKVSFQIATNQRGNLGASHVRLENPAHPVKYQGVVCSMKESFGFIERADVVKEIFFHFSENKAKDDLQLGDDVEFIIQTRNGKEVACNITTLPSGSVVFEDVADDIVKGQVLKPVERGPQARHTIDPLPGRIRYRAPDHSEVEIPFGDKDQKRDFTLRHGDWVQFRIATDRRDLLQRATNISLLPESFVVSGEKREQGLVAALKEGFGFLRCVEREPRLYFHFNEVLDMDREIALNDEVEFTVVQEQNTSSTYGSASRQSAIRIKHLPVGTVKFETVVEEGLSGAVTKEPPPSLWGSRSPTKNNSLSPGSSEKPPEPGIITYQSNGTKKTVPFYYKDCDPRNTPHLNDKVEFSISQVKRNKELIATNIVTKPQAQSVPMKNGISNSSPICQGFIAALKDGFGFIETIAHDREVFFHFSNVEGDSATLEVGQEVEYTLGSRGSSGSCKSAENVRILPTGTIAADVIVSDEVLEGFVVRPLRSVNPDQQHYSGLISLDPEGEENGSGYEFGITSLSNKRELLQVGDPVQFQVDSDGRAANVTAIRAKKKATVESIKDSYGFLNYEVEEGKKLFFHMSEVKDREKLSPGDTVEFVLVTNNRSKRSYATSVAKLSGEAAVGQRPERLISRLRTISLDDGPKLTVMRQPRGPDGTKGFSTSHRVPRSPGLVLE